MIVITSIASSDRGLLGLFKKVIAGILPLLSFHQLLRRLHLIPLFWLQTISEQVEHPGQHDTEAIHMIASDQNSVLNSMMSQTPCTQHMQYITTCTSLLPSLLQLARCQTAKCRVVSQGLRTRHSTYVAEKGGVGMVCFVLP